MNNSRKMFIRQDIGKSGNLKTYLTSDCTVKDWFSNLGIEVCGKLFKKKKKSLMV